MHVEEVIRKYCSTASGYDELYRDEQFEKYDFVFRRYGLSPRGRILDIGSGTCLLLEYLCSLNLLGEVDYIVALDVTHCMLRYCATKVRVCRIDHLVDLVVADASKLPFRDYSFDFSFSFTVYDLLPNPRAGVEEQNRVTRCRGVYTLLRRVEEARVERACVSPVGATSKDVVCLLSVNQGCQL